MIKSFDLIHKWGTNTYYHAGKSGPGSNGNEEVLHIPQNSLTVASRSDCLESYSGYLLVKVLTHLYWGSQRILPPQPIRWIDLKPNCNS